METVQERLIKLREERLAREKARLEKLRELNLKKYSSEPLTSKNSTKSSSVVSLIKKPSSAPIKKPLPTQNNVKKTNANRTFKPNTKEDIKKDVKPLKPNETLHAPNTSNRNNLPETKPSSLKTNKNANIDKSLGSRKSFALLPHSNKPNTVNQMKESRLPKLVENNQAKSRQSILPKQQNDGKKRESVFDRLYKPKTIPKVNVENDAVKLKTDPEYLRKVIKNSNLIMNKRHSVFEQKQPVMHVRRSISAVHFKRINKNELNNCVHKWASVGENINDAHLNEVDEDECVKEAKIVSAVKSERKRVKFQTPSNFNTPKPADLQARLHKWLQKRGKSLDSYHHLQCFGLHHIAAEKPSANKIDFNDEENKENIALEHDSDNDSFNDNVNEHINDLNNDIKNGFEMNKWRRASYVSDSVCNDSFETTLASPDVVHQADETLLGALHDLTELLREGFDWEQCARWLRAIREQFPEAPEGAAYWECRAALEERRGDLPASVQCWERAIANGTEQSVVEANLDQLLDKFMQLKISPSSGRKRAADPRLLDVKNVFKSTIIRFAVQQAKLRQSNGTPKFTVTPVRRSSRLSYLPRATPSTKPTPTVKSTPSGSASRPRTDRATPLQICSSFHQATELFPVEFKPNKALIKTP